MAYYFTVEIKKGNNIPLEIKNSIYFQTIQRKYTKDCAYSLQEIDSFTMMFDNELELRERLVEEGILPFELFKKPLSIRFYKNNMYKKIPYDFLYQEDIEYIMEPDRLISLIMKRYYQNEFIFIRKLSSHFSEVYECSTTAKEVVRLSEASIFQGQRHIGLEELDRNGDMPVSRMLKLLILTHYEKPNGMIEYKEQVNYRNLHDLIAFVNNYDKSNNPKQDIDEPVVSPEIKTFTNEHQNDEQSNIIVVKKRTRSKKIYNIDGQQSFDI